MKRLSWSKLVSLLAGLSLAVTSLVPGNITLAETPECAVPPCGTDLMVNGSFENPLVGDPANWDIYDSIPGWQAEWVNPGGAPEVAKIELQRAPLNGWSAKDGNQWTELDSDFNHPGENTGNAPASIRLYQDVPVIYGALYTLSFWTSPRPGYGVGDNAVKVEWGDTEIDTITAPDGPQSWTQHTYNVTATASPMQLAFTDMGTPNSFGMFLDNVELTQVCVPENCDFEGTGWYGEYFNYPRNHPDMNLPQSEWPDITHGDPMGIWSADWYTEPYLRFTQVDSGLTFGENFFPFDTAPEEIDNGHDYHFGAHWSAKVSGDEGSHPFILTTDDDAWVYLNGVLVADNSGIHPPATINGSMNFGEIPVIIDIYFAERHTVQSHMYFAFTGQKDEIIIQPYNHDCAQPVPTLTLEKTGEYNAETNEIEYTIDWEVTGEGTLYDVTITDQVPTGTTFISATPPGSESGGIVTWLLGHKVAPTDGTVSFVVSVDSYEPWADTVVAYNPGLQKGGGPLPAERTDASEALGEDTDTDAAPINYVSLGFGGDIVLGFNNYILDGIGPDIHIIETSYGNPPAASYPEKLEVLASQNGSDWTSLGIQTRSEINRDNDFDLGGFLPWAKYLKLVDKTDPTFAGFPKEADGYDVAGIIALYPAPGECSIDNIAHISGLSYEQETIEADASTTTTINEIACEEPEEENLTIIAHKIVCDREEDLPNWGNGGDNITSTTAQEWVNSHKGCYFVRDWEFQWGPQNAYDPGDTLIGPANAPWQTMPPTDANGMTTVTLTEDDIDGSSYLWFREELKEGYIPFTHDQNNNSNIDNVSAEMYCHIDVLNYDNYDRIDGIELGQTYNCVAFNVLSEALEHTTSGMKFNDYDGNGTKDGNDSGLADWTIYASQLIDTIQVEAQNELPTSPEFWTDELDNGKEYILRVSGTYDANDGITADAKYSIRSGPDWTDIVENYEWYGPTLLDLFVDDVAPNWGVFNPAHVYWQTIVGTGAQVKLQIYEIYAQNDSGALTVDVYEVIDKQITDLDGNYQFSFPEDIGEVMISEQTQDGWLQTLPYPDGYYMVSTGSNYTDKDFGNHYTIQIPGTVTGMKFNDHNSDGIKDDNDAGLAGWTIYAGKLVDTVEVDSHSLREDGDGDTIQSHVVLTNGKKYIIRATDTFSAGDGITADAQYSIRTGPDWTDLVENYGGWGVELLDLWINSNFSLWGSFNPAHTYWHTEIGTGNTISLHIHDIFASNNEGTLTVQIYEVLASAVTNDQGEYTLDLPTELTGDVIVAEETQEGWVQTYPMPEGYHIVPADGLTGDINFGNHDILEPNDEEGGNEENGGNGGDNPTGGGDGLDAQGSSGGGGGYTPVFGEEPTGGSGGDDEGTGGEDQGDVAGDTDEQQPPEQPGDTMPPVNNNPAIGGGYTGGGGSQVALGDGDEGEVEDQGDILGDADANSDDQSGDQDESGNSGWTVLGWVLFPLLLILIVIYLIYRWLNRKKGGSGMMPPTA